jgi:protein-disulfide isomerase
MGKARNDQTTKPTRAELIKAAGQPERSRTPLIAGVTAGVVALVALLVALTVANLPGGTGGTSTAVPATVSALGQPYTIDHTDGDDGVPTLEVFADYQCPACKNAEAVFGAELADLARAGKVKLQVTIMSFLDTKLGNDSSTRAAIGAGCAADAGRFLEYHANVFSAQQAEGAGYSDEVLAALAEMSGITGGDLTTWKQCYQDRTYGKHVEAAAKYANDKGVNATPTWHLNGERFELSNLVDDAGVPVPGALEKVLAEATTS